MIDKKENYAIIISNLKKDYKSKKKTIHALKGISLKIKKGEIFGLLGPNGAGKTTTINILNNILSTDSGTIKFFGKKLNEKIQNKMNTATAYNGLNNILTVKQNLTVYAKIYNVKNYKNKINSLLKEFYINDIKDKKFYDLSTGQKTRVNLCKCLINTPNIILLDEATAGLDPHIASEVRKIIKKLNCTIIFTSHIMYEVEELCDRIAFLNKGKIIKIDTPSNIKKLIKQDILMIDFSFQPKKAKNILKKFNVINKNKNKISIELKNSKDLNNIIHELVKHKFEIKEFHIKKTNLDDIFIKMAKGEFK